MATRSTGATPSSTPLTPRHRTRLPPETRRRQIVAEATRLISRSGYNAVSLADIAEACDLRKPSVLHYFPTMADLLEEVLAQRDLEEYRRGGIPLDAPEPAEVRQRLRQVVEHNLEIRELIRLYVMLQAEAQDPEHPAHGFFSERLRLSIVLMEQMLSWKPDPPNAARQLIAFWQGLESLWIADPSLDVLGVWDSFCDIFFV